MSAITQYQPGGLPANIYDLSKFILVGREKLTAVRAEIRAISKIELAQEVRNQKMEEARMLSEALLDAEVKLGEMTKNIPKASGGDRRSEDFKSDTAVVFEKSKKDAITELGFTPKQVERFETLANNQDLVEQVKREARENDDLPTRSQVISLAQVRKKQQETDLQQISEDAKRHKEFVGMVYTVLKFIGSEEDLEAVTDAIVRSAEGNVRTEVANINSAIEILAAIQAKIIEKGGAYGKKQIPGT